MGSNLNKQILALVTIGLFLSACTPGLNAVTADKKNENIIGVRLSSNSKLQSSTEEDSDKVVLFDKTVKKVHHFDLIASEHLGSYDVEQPDIEHFLVYGSNKNYYIDLSKKHISVQSLSGKKTTSSLKFVGTPISAGYDEKQGYLIVYDSYQSVLFYKLDGAGNIVGQYISGPVVGADGTIQAGDVSGNGKLILSIRGTPDANTGVSKDFIYVVDIEQTIATQTLVGTKVPTDLTEMTWVSPVPSGPDLVLIRSKDKISLMNLTTNVVTSQPTTDWVVEKYSKVKDPHLVLRKNYEFETASSNIERRIMFVENGTIVTKILTNNFNFIINSHLDVKKNQWNVTRATKLTEYDLFNSFNTVEVGRTFTRIRLSDLLSTIDTKIDDSALVEISGNYLFSLYSQVMGYATSVDIETNETRVIRNFNVKYMK